MREVKVKPKRMDLLVAFSDLSGFTRFVSAVDDRRLFQTMSEYFEFAGEIIEEGGGVIVKCIGDQFLAAFPAPCTEKGIRSLLRLREEGDRWLKKRGIPCSQLIKAHVGPVFAGPIGSANDKRFDVYGKTVNAAALMPSEGLSISAEALKYLPAAMKKKFRRTEFPPVYLHR